MEFQLLSQEQDIQGSICNPVCPLGVFLYTSVSITSLGNIMVITTSPFQVLFHLAEMSIPTIGGGVVRRSVEEENLVCLAILNEMTKHIKIH